MAPGTLQMYRHRFAAMGCPCEIRLYADSVRAAASAFVLTVTEVRRLDVKYSHYRTDSELARILQAAARPQGVRVDSETAALFDFAARLYAESGGRFDITAGRLCALWDRATSLPEAPLIESALALTGWQRLAWDGSTLRLPVGMRLDLGGIVKEYAADRAALLLKSNGYHSGYVDLGGDLHVLGPHPDGSAWQIGIRHPREAGAMATVALSHGGLATSGDYERCSIIHGKRYSHILNARTGWPVSGLASVSVIAPTCLLAGALSTLAMVQDREQGLDLLATSGLTWLAHDGRCSFAGRVLEDHTPVQPGGGQSIRAMDAATKVASSARKRPAARFAASTPASGLASAAASA